MCVSGLALQPTFLADSLNDTEFRGWVVGFALAEVNLWSVVLHHYLGLEPGKDHDA
jgi:hypothetical protein